MRDAMVRGGRGLAAALLASLALGACDDDNDHGGAGVETVETEIAPSLGPVFNATVKLYADDGVTLLGSGELGSAGTVTIAIEGYTGPVLAEVLGDADASYFDEAAGTALPFGDGAVLRALAAAPGGTLAVTPLTELAYQLAAGAGQFPITAAQVEAVNDSIREALAPGLNSILSAATVFDASTTAGSLDDTEAGRYALLLASMATLGDTEAAPILAVLQALINDISDGLIDGQVDGEALLAPYADFVAEMTAALVALAEDYGTAALQAAAQSQAPVAGSVSTGGDGPNGETEAATVHASLVSQYTLEATSNQAGSPFTDGEMVLVIVGTDGSLTIGEGAPLTDPFVRRVGGSVNPAEIIWYDATRQLEYALSNNGTGSFNEINVGDASQPMTDGIPAFLGQLVEAGGGDGVAGIELVQGLAGEYTVSEVLGGSHARMSLTIGGDGTIDYDEALRFAPEDFDAIYDRLDCCDRITVEMQVQDDDNKPRIDLFLDAEGDLVRVQYFSNGLDSPGSEVDVGGEPLPDPAEGNSGPRTLADGEGFTGVIDGTAHTFFDTAVLLPNNSGDGIFRIEASDPENGLTKWRLIAPEAPGTYACDESGDSVGLQFIDNGGSGPDSGVGSGGGDCVIRITEAGNGNYVGFFTGQLVANDNMTLLQVTDGFFDLRVETPPEPSTDEVPAGESGMSYTVGGEAFVVQPAEALANTPYDGYLTMVSPDGSLVQWRQLPNATGTYVCGEGPEAGREFHVWFNHRGKVYYAGYALVGGPEGASCTMTLTRTGDMPLSGSDYSGFVEGTFSGTLIAADGSTITVSDGFIRAFGAE